MSKRLMWGLVVLLIITNAVTLFFWYNQEDDNQEKHVILNDQDQVQETQGNEDNIAEVVARIGHEEIVYDEFISSIKETHGQRHLKEMIDRSVVNQLAEKENIKIDEKIVNREISFLTSMNGVMTNEEREKQEASWKEDVTYRYELESLLTKEIEIPEKEVKTYFENYKNQYNFDASMQVSHIIVDSIDIADKVIKELDEGASFDLLAQEYSKDDETKDSGGYVGFFVSTSQFFPRGYREIARDMEEDSYSEPFNLGNDVAVLYLHRRLPEIVFTFDEMKPYIENELGLNEAELSLSAASLWDELEIDWIYADK